MTERSEIGLRHALKDWQSRQRADGNLAAVLVLASIFPTVYFLCAPSPVTASVMGLFLCALGIACFRLLNSAAQVVEIRDRLQPRFAASVIEVEVLPIFSHPAGMEEPVPAYARSKALLN